MSFISFLLALRPDFSLAKAPTAAPPNSYYVRIRYIVYDNVNLGNQPDT